MRFLFLAATVLAAAISTNAPLLAAGSVSSQPTPYVPGEFNLEELCTQRHASESRRQLALRVCIDEATDGSGEPGEGSGECPAAVVQENKSELPSS